MSLNNNFAGENEPSKTMRQLKGLIRMVKGGGLCLTAVQAEGKREAEEGWGVEERDGGAGRVREKEGSGRSAKGSAKLNRYLSADVARRPSVQTLGTRVLVCRRIIMVKRVRKHPNILRLRRGYESISYIYV